MKDRIIEVIERLKDVPYKNGDFILTHSWVVRVAEEIEPLIFHEVEQRIAEKMPNKEEIKSKCERDINEWLTDSSVTEKQHYRVAFRRSFEFICRRMGGGK